jgi:predicted Zn-dependent peptidase
MVDEAVAARKPPTYWGAALRPRELDVRSIRGREIVELYEQITAKDTLRIAIGGPFQPAQVREVWGKKEAAWPAPKYIARSPFPPSGRIRPRNPGGVTTLEFAGPTFAADDAALPTRLLALVALGSGKGSSLFRVARGELALSYRQEALLAPSPKGWQPRLILAMRPRADEVEVVSTLRTALLSDVERWSEAHRLRAVGMADLSLTRATELSPLSLWRTGPVPNNLEGRTFLKAYWPMKTGQAWNPERLADATRNVTLADLKAAAHELLEQANVTLLTGASGATPQTPRDDDRGEGSRTSGTRP